MGMFVNPGNSAFQKTLNSKIYVDKTDFLMEMNHMIDTEQCCICNSRPRRFGKSVTANMLVAYYSKGCDSEHLFVGTNISKETSFREHLNQYNVIHLDIQWCLAVSENKKSVVDYIQQKVMSELQNLYPDILNPLVETLAEALALISQSTGEKFVIIIDEWDVLIREESANIAVQEKYLNFLRSLFKGTEPTKFLHLAFLTGILPIKKQTTQSALNNFYEFSMLDAKTLSSYIGFTEEEVQTLCKQYDRDFDEVKRWYDGYLLGEYHIYNPNAVVNLMLWGTFQSYWSQTGTYESIQPLLTMNFDGLKTAIISMLSGTGVKVRTTTFKNDMVGFKNKDDVLTVLIHLGYLAYNLKEKTAFIPNEEIRAEFEEALEETRWSEWLDFQKQSDELLEATLAMDSGAVAKKIEQIHMEFVSSIQYHDENSLSSVLAIAYLSTMKYYFKPIRELPTGRGFADFVFIPKMEFMQDYPALVVELKWNQSAKTAIQQIKEKKYPASIESYTGNLLLIGINYNKKNKEHQCLIEKHQKK